jgi:hypothetical protein
MIAFGAAITDREVYERVALPGIRRAAEPDSVVLTRADLPIREAYEEIMEEVAGEPRLEALVLLHQDLELTDDSLPRRARRLMADRRTGLAGSLGARGVILHLWLASRDLYGAVYASDVQRRFTSGAHEVECVDGALLMLAPWVVRGLRFGAAAGAGFHGYDVDAAMWVRAHGGRVVCEEIPHFHHRERKQDFEAQRRAGVELARRWDPDLRPPEWEPSFQL